MPDLWMPGALRIESPKTNPLNGNGYRLITWHTFEAGYALAIADAMRILIRNGSEAFVFHPLTGEWAQCQPMTTGARTLKAPDGIATNRFGSVHQQVEVIGYAAKPWTDDLTPAGREGLARGLAFFREWGIPDQWAFDQPPPAYPGPGVARGYPSRSGHAYHSGWIGNDHGDPGAIAAPWTVAGQQPDPQVTAQQEALVEAGLLATTDVDGIDGPITQAAQEAYEMTLANLETKLDAIGVKLDTHATALDRIEAAVRGIPRAVAGFVSNGRDLVTWMRLGAGALRLTPEGTEVGILPPVPPLAADDVLSKPAKP